MSKAGRIHNDTCFMNIENSSFWTLQTNIISIVFCTVWIQCRVLTFNALIVQIESISWITIATFLKESIKILAVGISLLAVAVLIKIISKWTFYAFSWKLINLIAVSNCNGANTDSTVSILYFISWKTASTYSISNIICFTSWINMLTFFLWIKEKSTRAFNTCRSIECVTIGIEAIAIDARKTCILNNSKSRIAR